MSDEIRHGLEGVVVTETKLSHVDGVNGQLVIREHDIEAIIDDATYEALVYLVWNGNMPNEQQLSDFTADLSARRNLSSLQRTTLDAMPRDITPMAALRTLTSCMEPRQDYPPQIEDGKDLVAIMPTIMAAVYHHRNGTAYVAPHEDLGHTANYLYMLHGAEPTAEEVKALDTYLMLGVDHGLNCSTFTARVVTSSESDLVSSIVAGICALKGPLHGGAPTLVDDLLDKIGTIDNVEPCLRDMLENGDRLMGFGHRVYKTYDPRAAALKKVAEGLGNNEKMELSRAVEKTAVKLLAEYKPGKDLYPNVEFWAAAVLRTVDLPRELYPPTFAVSRVGGWVAHCLEQADNNRLFRPASKYIGHIPPKVERDHDSK